MIKFLTILMLLAAFIGTDATAQDRFGRDAAVQSPGAAEPSLVQTIAGTIAAWQREFNRDLRHAVRNAKDGAAFGAVTTIIGLSFLYGIFHAAGPGHGKMVTTTWFLTRKSDWRAGALMGAAIAVVQAMSALLIVGGMGLVLNLSPITVTTNAFWVEAASYVLIIGLGLVMAVRIARGKDSCGHDIGHHHHHHGHDHDHHHGHHHGHHHHHEADPKEMERRGLLLTAAAVGIRPCTGALLVLLFTLANGIFWVGVLGTLAMAVGVFITVTAIGTGAIAVHKLASHLPAPSAGMQIRIQQGIGLVGALLIITVGALMLTGTAVRQGLM